jgi:hypothetical protein
MSDPLTERAYMIYCCADATLTYAPYGSPDRPIPQALPVATVDTAEQAEEIVTLVSSKTYIENDDYAAPPGSGPESRYRYSLPDFVFNDPDTLWNVGKTLDAIREGRVHEAFAEARERGRDLGRH